MEFEVEAMSAHTTAPMSTRSAVVEVVTRGEPADLVRRAEVLDRGRGNAAWSDSGRGSAVPGYWHGADLYLAQAYATGRARRHSGACLRRADGNAATGDDGPAGHAGAAVTWHQSVRRYSLSFPGSQGSVAQALWHDGVALSLLVRRLEHRHFPWPMTLTGSITLSPAQASLLLEGLEWRTAQREWRPTAA